MPATILNIERTLKLILILSWCLKLRAIVHHQSNKSLTKAPLAQTKAVNIYNMPI